MANVLNRVTKDYRQSVNTPDCFIGDTVTHRIWSVCNKLGAETRAQAVSLFVRSGKPSQLEDAE